MENGPHAAERLQRMTLAAAGADRSLRRHGFAGALVERAVSRRIGDPSGSQPLVFVGDDLTEFRVDATQLVAPRPGFHGMVATETFEMWVRRKLHTYSAGHAAVAYLGYLKGYHYVHTAIRDREIRAAVLAAMVEGQRGLVARYGPELGGRPALLRILARFGNASLGDRIERVGRDAERQHGAAAALCFVDPGDAAAADVERAIERDGFERTIRRVCGLGANRGLGRLVSQDCDRGASGRHGGGLLLTLGSEITPQAAAARARAAAPHEEAAARVRQRERSVSGRR